MLRSTFLAIGLSLAVLAPSSVAADPGSAYCFGSSCPCGNDSATGGCTNSSGAGALMSATGSASLAASDLNFHGSSLPFNTVSLLVFGPLQQEVPFFDGKLCIGGQINRLYKHQNSGQSGVVDFNDVIGQLKLNAVPISFDPGDTRNFQIWFRDAPAAVSPCGTKANISNAYSVTFQP